MTREQLDGVYFVLLTPDNPEFPPVAIECTGELSQGAIAWNIYRMSANVEYIGKPRELDPEKVIKRLNGQLPPNADVSKD